MKVHCYYKHQHGIKSKGLSTGKNLVAFLTGGGRRMEAGDYKVITIDTNKLKYRDVFARMNIAFASTFGRPLSRRVVDLCMKRKAANRTNLTNHKDIAKKRTNKANRLQSVCDMLSVLEGLADEACKDQSIRAEAQRIKKTITSKKTSFETKISIEMNSGVSGSFRQVGSDTGNMISGVIKDLGQLKSEIVENSCDNLLADLEKDRTARRIKTFFGMQTATDGLRNAVENVITSVNKLLAEKNTTVAPQSSTTPSESTSRLGSIAPTNTTSNSRHEKVSMGNVAKNACKADRRARNTDNQANQPKKNKKSMVEKFFKKIIS